jgi:hypothetical protein
MGLVHSVTCHPVEDDTVQRHTGQAAQVTMTSCVLAILGLSVHISEMGQ